MKIGIIVAMDKEAALVKKLLKNGNEEIHGQTNFFVGKWGLHDVFLLTSGPGKVSATIGTVEMIKAYKPDGIINSGVAGGVSDLVKQGDLVVSQQICYHDVWCGEGNEKGQMQGLPSRFEAYSPWVQTVEALRNNYETPIHIGLLCSGDQFITSSTEIFRIREDFPDALAVDMESGAIAQTCYIYKIPFLCCRMISDTPAQTQDHSKQYWNFWETAAENSFAFLSKLIESL